MRSSGTCSRPTKQQIFMAVYVFGHSSTETKIIPSTQYAFLLSSSDHCIMTTCSPSRRSARRSAAVRIAKALQHHARQAASGSEGTSHKSADRSPYWRSRRAASRAPRTGEPRGRVLSAGVPNRGFSPLLGHPWRRRREPFPHLPDGEIFVKWSRRGDKKQKRTLTFFFSKCAVSQGFISRVMVAAMILVSCSACVLLIYVTYLSFHSSIFRKSKFAVRPVNILRNISK